jgi:3-isopropylmalate/(R)-2-methylmalate dehydratase large subunit
MGMTGTEKILTRVCGKSALRPGEIVYPDPDLVFVHDLMIAGCKTQFDGLGITSLFDADRVIFATDHTVLYTTPQDAARGAATRKAAREWGVKKFFDVGQGGHAHIFPMEMGYVTPGTFAFANDLHCTNYGAIGAMAVRTGGEILSVLATGTMWVEVPPSIRVTLTGSLQKGVYGRDFGFYLAHGFTSGHFGMEWDYRVLEFSGVALDGLSLSTRVAICNTATEIGVANIFFPPNEKIIAFASANTEKAVLPVFSDEDAEFEGELTVDLGDMEPQVVLPGSLDRICGVSEAAGKHVDHAYVGSCGSGMYEDLQVTAGFLKGKKVAATTRLFIVPGSVASARRMLSDGLMEIFIDAGAIVLPSGCGPCSQGNMAPLSAGEVSISTAATNGAGRMGAKDAEIYLASPATVACSAIAGKITDPRSYLS